MACPTDLSDDVIAHGPAPVAEEPYDGDGAVVEALPTHRFHGVTPHLTHSPNDQRDVPLVMCWSRQFCSGRHVHESGEAAPVSVRQSIMRHEGHPSVSTVLISRATMGLSLDLDQRVDACLRDK